MMKSSISLDRCLCGSKRFRVAKKDFRTKRSGIDITVKNTDYIECLECGEIYYDEGQSRKLARTLDREWNKKLQELKIPIAIKHK
ncbi:MAG TPA: YgiT-type zinc finger protein [archaeon]|nr:YgiT-type zinc finger protein [archaeon]